MYTVRFQLELSASEKRFLSKSFFYANQMHNQLVHYATNCLNTLFHDKEYLRVCKAYGESGFSKKETNELSASEKKKKKELSSIMNNKQKECKLTKGALYKFVSKEQKKYKNYINSLLLDAVKTVISTIMKIVTVFKKNFLYTVIYGICFCLCLM